MRTLKIILNLAAIAIIAAALVISFAGNPFGGLASNLIITASVFCLFGCVGISVWEKKKADQNYVLPLALLLALAIGLVFVWIF